MEAALPQRSQPGVTSPPLRPKPVPPPRNPSFRRGSQDGRIRTDGMKSPTSGSNPSSPLSSPPRVPGGNTASPATSPQRKPDVVRSHAMPQQPGESRGSDSSPAISPVRTLLETQQKGTIELLVGPERRGADGTSQISPEVEDRKADSSPQNFSLVNNQHGAPHVPGQQQRSETKVSGTSLQWTTAERQPWRNEMSTSFSSSPRPAPLDIGENHVQSPQQILERTRQSPASPRWIQPGSRATDDNRIQHPIRMEQGANMTPAKTPQMESNENASLTGVRIEVASSNGIRETCLVNTLHPQGVPDTVTDSDSTSLVPETISPQHVTGSRLVSDIAKPPESQVLSPKRVYSYSVILTGTSNIQSNPQGIGLSTGSDSPSHIKLESPTWSTAPGTNPLVTLIAPSLSMSTSDVLSRSTIEFQPSADSAAEIRPSINPTSPKRNLMSKPPLPFPSVQRVGSTDGHPSFPSSALSSLQYIAPKSSLYSVLNPVPEHSHNSSDIVSQSVASTEPGLQPTPVSGPAFAPESALASSPRKDAGSLSSLDPGLPTYRSQPPAPDSMSYLDSVSMMSGTMESLSLMDDASSMGSDSEVNGMSYRRTDKYGFLGGNQFSAGMESSLHVDVARQREMKWLDMFKHWDKWVSRRFQKVKLRCRKGIPSSLRARAWQHLSNSKELIERNPAKFDELERDPGDPKWLDVIEKDLHRQFPFHEMFVAREGHGQKDLYRILKAYTIYRPDEGYCQAQAPVAAVLLMHMPAEQAFWCLVQICEKYLPGYYSAGLEAIQLDGEIFFALLRRASPMAYRHLKKYKIDPILYMTEWFMCIFSRTLPWSSVLRVWDMFFCEGVKIIFRVGLVILRHTLGSVDKLRSCQGMYETMEKLRSLPSEYLQESFLVQEICSLPVTEALIERENSTQLKKWRENRGELQYKPSRRLHGTRAIFEEHHRMNPLTASSSLLSLTSLRRASKEERWRDKGQKEAPGFSPAHSIGNLALSSGPSAAPSATTVNQSTNNVAKPKGQKTKGKAEKPDAEVKKPTLSAMPPGHVVSEGLHPALPSPTGNVMPLGEPKKAKDRKKERDLEKQRVREQKEKDRQDKERERLEKEQEKEMEKQRAKEQKENERLEKEKERKLQKERAKEEARQKKERKLSVRKKEVPPGTQEKGAGDSSNQPENVAEVHVSVSEPATQVSTEERVVPTGSTGVAVV